MANPHIGEIRAFAFNRIPTGWMACDGQILKVLDYQALHSLLGNRYGGDNKRTFGLPDLRGRTPVGMGHIADQGQSRLSYALGAGGGGEAVALPSDRVLAHTHAIAVQSGVADSGSPNGTFLADAREATGAADLPTYALPGTMVALDKASVTTTGGGQPLPIRQPYQVLTYCIAVKGEYPAKAD